MQRFRRTQALENYYAWLNRPKGNFGNDPSFSRWISRELESLSEMGRVMTAPLAKARVLYTTRTRVLRLTPALLEWLGITLSKLRRVPVK